MHGNAAGKCVALVRGMRPDRESRRMPRRASDRCCCWLRNCIEAHTETRRDSDSPDTYKSFTLVCPSLSAVLRPVATGLARLRGAESFYDDKPGSLKPTKEEVDKRLRKAGLDDYIDFICAKVYFGVGLRYIFNTVTTAAVSAPSLAKPVMLTISPGLRSANAASAP